MCVLDGSWLISRQNHFSDASLAPNDLTSDHFVGTPHAVPINDGFSIVQRTIDLLQNKVETEWLKHAVLGMQVRMSAPLQHTFLEKLSFFVV